jgi:TonB family protein
MRHHRGSVALVIGLVACSDKASDATPSEAKPEDTKVIATPEKEAPSAEAPITGDAVVRAGARLFFAPTGDGGFELPTLTASRGMAAHVVGEENGRLVIETLSNDPAEHHCAATLDGLDDFRLRFHITKEDLLPVLAEPISHPMVDGTKISVAAGVAVPRGADQIYVRGTAVTLTVADIITAKSYKPGAPFGTDGADGILAPLEGHTLTYDLGKTLAEDALFDGGSGATLFGKTEHGDHALVTVRNACLEATVKVSLERARKQVSGMYAMKGPRDAIPEMAEKFDPDMAARNAGILGKLEAESGHFLASPYGGAFAVADDEEDVWGGLTGTEIGEAYGVGGLGLVGTGRGARQEYLVKAGAAIWYADGRSAGQVVSEHRFATPPRDEGGRKCFDAPLTSGNPATIALCFAPADLAEVAGGSGSIGLGSVGLIGKGGGGGTGTGFGGSGFGSGKVPRVKQAVAEVKGSLDKDIIRRIVRAHINEIRYCYNQGLVKDPKLEGKVTIQFTIGPAGSVPVAVVSDSTVSDEAVGMCAAKAVKRWKFPKPEGGGNVVVTYPFVLEPG